MTERKVSVVGISGPTGSGKNYLTDAASKALGLSRVTMITTRPARSANEEDKIPVSLAKFLSYHPENDLVGRHKDEKTQIWYAYRVDELKIAGNSIIELSPLQQTEMADQLARLGINMVGWIGLHAKIDYLIHNVNSRETMSPEDIEKRMQRSREFMEKLKNLHDQGIVTKLFEVGWHNRETMGKEFIELVKGIFGK